MQDEDTGAAAAMDVSELGGMSVPLTAAIEVGDLGGGMDVASDSDSSTSECFKRSARRVRRYCEGVSPQHAIGGGWMSWRERERDREREREIEREREREREREMKEEPYVDVTKYTRASRHFLGNTLDCGVYPNLFSRG